MELKEISRQLSLEVKSAAEHLNTPITGGYASDLLSCVMAKAQQGNVWITMQGHPNIVAVASLLNLAGIIITEGIQPDATTLKKAQQNNLPILTTPLTTYTLCGRLFELGVEGVDS